MSVIHSLSWIFENNNENDDDHHRHFGLFCFTICSLLSLLSLGYHFESRVSEKKLSCSDIPLCYPRDITSIIPEHNNNSQETNTKQRREERKRIKILILFRLLLVISSGYTSISWLCILRLLEYHAASVTFFLHIENGPKVIRAYLLLSKEESHKCPRKL